MTTSSGLKKDNLIRTNDLESSLTYKIKDMPATLSAESYIKQKSCHAINIKNKPIIDVKLAILLYSWLFHEYCTQAIFNIFTFEYLT